MSSGPTAVLSDPWRATCTPLEIRAISERLVPIAGGPEGIADSGTRANCAGRFVLFICCIVDFELHYTLVINYLNIYNYLILSYTIVRRYEPVESDQSFSDLLSKSIRGFLGRIYDSLALLNRSIALERGDCRVSEGPDATFIDAGTGKIRTYRIIRPGMIDHASDLRHRRERLFRSVFLRTVVQKS